MGGAHGQAQSVWRTHMAILTLTPLQARLYGQNSLPATHPHHPMRHATLTYNPNAVVWVALDGKPKRLLHLLHQPARCGEHAQMTVAENHAVGLHPVVGLGRGCSTAQMDERRKGRKEGEKVSESRCSQGLRHCAAPCGGFWSWQYAEARDRDGAGMGTEGEMVSMPRWL